LVCLLPFAGTHLKNRLRLRAHDYASEKIEVVRPIFGPFPDAYPWLHFEHALTEKMHNAHQCPNWSHGIEWNTSRNTPAAD
jgi:hypothetical protein